MKPLLHILFLLLAFTAGVRPHTYDVVIVGGTPAGITAAVAAAREGKNSVILERSDSRSTDWVPRTSPRGAPRRGCSPASSR